MSTADGRRLNPILRQTTPRAEWIQSKIDRSNAVRTVPMKVLVLGFPKTGSVSTSAALYLLGYDDVYHHNALVENPLDAKMWWRAVNAKFKGEGEFMKRDVRDYFMGF